MTGRELLYLIFYLLPLKPRVTNRVSPQPISPYPISQLTPAFTDPGL
jgi:hypothetical protein